MVRKALSRCSILPTENEPSFYAKVVNEEANSKSARINDHLRFPYAPAFKVVCFVSSMDLHLIWTASINRSNAALTMMRQFA